MPSAQAKQRRKEKRAAKQSGGTEKKSHSALDEDVARLNEDQHKLNARRKVLLARISERETTRSMEQFNKHPVVLSQATNSSEQRESETVSTACDNDNGHNLVDQSRPTGAISADRSSQSGAACTESHRQQAPPSDNPAINPLTLLESTYPQRLKAASSAAVQELLELLHLYEPPSEPVARKTFESGVYKTVKRILRNQKQRAYRKTKKKGML